MPSPRVLEYSSPRFAATQITQCFDLRNHSLISTNKQAGSSPHLTIPFKNDDYTGDRSHRLHRRSVSLPSSHGDLQLISTPSSIGTILTSMLALHPSYDITVLLRPTTELTPFKPLGVSIATAETEEEVAQVAIDFDVVIHEASASNVPWIKGLITGLERRARQESEVETRRKPVFMYGGGTGVMEDDCRGEYESDKTWSVSGLCMEGLGRSTM